MDRPTAAFLKFSGWMIGLDAWWEEPAYQASRETFTEPGTFILAKLHVHDAAKPKDVLADVYRDDVPDPADMTKFEWEVILRFMGACQADAHVGS